jgi:hypothetical protein
MGTADNRARADTGRLRSALAVPAVERNRDKCRPQLLQAVGGYRCDIYGNHVSLRLHPLFPITNASPVCAVRRASVHYLPGEGELDECAFVIAPYSKHGTWLFNDERRNLVEEPLVAAAPETIAKIVADIPNAKAGFRLTFLQGPFPSASTNSRSRASDRRNTRKRIPCSGRSSYSAMLVFPGRVASERPSGNADSWANPRNPLLCPACLPEGSL